MQDTKVDAFDAARSRGQLKGNHLISGVCDLDNVEQFISVLRPLTPHKPAPLLGVISQHHLLFTAKESEKY